MRGIHLETGSVTASAPAAESDNTYACDNP
jgi:hypothetical protein